MELSELTAYAEEKFHMQEQHNWSDFPGFSVLADPNTGKWVALLMRQWDYNTGTEIQRCDIKCGQRSLTEISASYLTLPFRMKGKKWVGVKFEKDTEPEVVFRLFDRAVYSGKEQGYTLVLEEAPVREKVIYQDTPLPVIDTGISITEPEVPDRIREMRKLYDYKDSSFRGKCMNFFRQGKFMEDYEDNAPWTGEYRRYFTVYHDLYTRQLRGYFTWRAGVRKGKFSPIAASLAYMYLYELLTGIGTDSPEDGLRKMQEFETGFLDSGIGNPDMRRNLKRWMLEYAVTHDVSPELARRYASPALLKKDTALSTLRDPDGFTDEELFSALCAFAGKKLEQSRVVKKNEARGKHLFAEVWRHGRMAYYQNGKDLFTACFGKRKTYPWRPFANAVYWEEQPHPDTDYELDGCRTYQCRGGVWKETRYDSLYYNRELFQAFLHETDRRLRKYLQTGCYLRENPAEAWAAVYAEAVIEADRQAEIEAARPKITIDLSHLEQIREDALITRDSLLTEEELDGSVEEEREKQTVKAQNDGGKPGALPAEEQDARAEQKETELADFGFPALDKPYAQILRMLLQGESPEGYMKTSRLMPSVAADAINEAFFDEIGDNILECDGDTIMIVEDYREDILQMLGGKNG